MESESERERLLRERAEELETVKAALQKSEQALATELDAVQRLQHVATHLINSQGVEALYEQILATTMAILHAEFAAIQVFYPDAGPHGALSLLSYRGLTSEAVKRWEWVSPTSRTASGEALRTGRRVGVPDVRNCDFMAGSEDLEGYLAAGILAVQSTPLVSRSGELLGMVSTHWGQPHQPSACDLRSLDILARLAADCIERLRAEEALWENQQRVVSIYDTVRDVIFHLAVEPEGHFRFVSVNAAFLKVTGLSREMIIGKTVNQVIPEPSLMMVLGKYRQAIEENATLIWEETSDYPSGRLTGEVTVVPVFDNKGTCTHLVGSVHDITERKRAEAALRESEERLKNAERLAHVGSWRWDLQSNEVGWSEEMFHIFGQPKDYKPSYEGGLQLVIPQDRERLRRVSTDCLAEKKGFNVEFQIARPDGEMRTVDAFGEPLLDEKGRPVSFVGACLDITDIRRAQREDFARQKLESIGTLANGIAHDFNNLLGGVLAQAELAVSEVNSGSSPKRELEAIQELALRGSETVRELMVYAGKESAAVSLIDVSGIVKEMIELLKVSVSKHAVLEVDLGQDLPFVNANAAQIRQIVMNLVTNASEAIGDLDGTIRVITRCSRWADGDFVQLEVCDTGRGIPLGTQAKVFDPFFTTKSAGHGLGLSVVQGIVRGLRGFVELESEFGKGTSVRIWLPGSKGD